MDDLPAIVYRVGFAISTEHSGLIYSCKPLPGSPISNGFEAGVAVGVALQPQAHELPVLLQLELVLVLDWGMRNTLACHLKLRGLGCSNSM